MRLKRVHSVIAGATLAAVLAGSTLVATAEAAPQPVGTQAQHSVGHHGLIPAADPSTALGVLGKLGAVQSLIGQITAAAGKTPPDTAAIQGLVPQLTQAVSDLKAAVPAPPLPVSGKPAPHSGGQGLPVPVPVPLPNPLGDALTKLTGDVTALVAALTKTPPDAGAVTAALTSTVTDLLAVVTQTVASLGLSLPLPVAHH
ncbi:hypothetical protein [Streptacidiphilus jiangxiensis]|uniref:Secreted protein n=1 Tax=Streptacidiphilus jiangxiensis TaxID=235985 RepID=A0A1H7FCH3_STRJI|nr:hypothetical protein [Streptacidiphilus jiangxiensis]SEK20935.1 hypothetical protein SAMN05414137_10184 [Streptacidiphilus jiangxiensis]